MAHQATSPSPMRGQAKTSHQWKIAAALAFAGALVPFPITGIHKFYLGQPIWGGIYLLLGWTQIPRIACAVEGVWFLSRSQRLQDSTTSLGGDVPDGVRASEQTQAIAIALRELEQLRQEGLISEQEFEQNRRSLLAKLS